MEKQSLTKQCAPCTYWRSKFPQEVFQEILFKLGTLKNVTSLVSTCTCGHFLEVAKGVQQKLLKSVTTSYFANFLEELPHLYSRIHYEFIMDLEPDRADLEQFFSVSDSITEPTSPAPLLDKILEAAMKKNYKEQKFIAFLDAHGAHVYVQMELHRRVEAAETENKEHRARSRLLQEEIDQLKLRVEKAELRVEKAEAESREKDVKIRALTGTVVRLYEELERVRPLAAIADSLFSKSAPGIAYRNCGTCRSFGYRRSELHTSRFH